MSPKKSVTSNTISSFAIGVMRIIFPLITVPYISRMLGPENLGRVNFLRSIVFYFNAVAGLGVSQYANRKISKVKKSLDKRSKFFFEIQSLLLITRFTAMVVFFLLIYYFPAVVKGNLSLSFILGTFIMISFFNIDWFFQGMERFD